MRQKVGYTPPTKNIHCKISSLTLRSSVQDLIQIVWLTVPDTDSHETCTDCGSKQGFPIDQCTFRWVTCVIPQIWFFYYWISHRLKNKSLWCVVSSGAYERRSHEGACNSGSIQILIAYIFPFWWGAMRVMRSVTYFRSCGYVGK